MCAPRWPDMQIDDRTEWLEADGLGGFASGTSSGVRTRRYHALLLTAMTPPTGRVVLVNGFDAWADTPAGSFALSTQRYVPDTLYPDGAVHLTEFTTDPWPTWEYELADGTRVMQEIFVQHGTSTVVVIWTLVRANGPVVLRARPFLSGRDYHSMHHQNGALRFDAADAGADYVAGHGYKWLLGPRGAAWLWVRPERLAELEPLAPSWKTVADPYAEYYGGPLEPASTARKLDATLAWFSWPGARAALDLLASLDEDAVERRCLELAGTFREEAARRGFALTPEEVPSQVVGVRVPDPKGARERLLERKVIAAVRADLLRLGFHAYNDESDVATALDALGTARG